MTAATYFYRLLQWTVGAPQQQDYLIRELIQPKHGDAILDIGCGPASIVGKLSSFGISYRGIDENPKSIAHAKQRWQDLPFCSVACTAIEDAALEPETYDTVLALSVLHHLSNEALHVLLKEIRLAMKPGGKFITLDPVRLEDATLLEKALVRWDRGQHIRKVEEYESLVGRHFQDYELILHPHLGRFPARSLLVRASR